jgi:hypothetical protein
MLLGAHSRGRRGGEGREDVEQATDATARGSIGIS